MINSISITTFIITDIIIDSYIGNIHQIIEVSAITMITVFRSIWAIQL